RSLSAECAPLSRSDLIVPAHHRAPTALASLVGSVREGGVKATAMIRKTIRSLLKSPGFAVASIVALALGIGANTAIYSLVNTVLLRPLPYKDPSRLVMLWQLQPSGDKNTITAADFQDWRDRSRSFEQMAAMSGVDFNFTGGDRPEKVFGLQ